MIQKLFVLSQCIVHILGISADVNDKRDDLGSPFSLDHSWETEHFTNGDALVQDESENHFFALREQRDTTPQQEDDDISSASGEPCEPVSGRDCHPNATCLMVSNPVSIKCTCKSGFSGDGKTCQDINECAQNNNPCSPNALCKNTVGSFECTCTETYYGNGKVCTEISTNYSSNKVYTKPGESAVLVCSLNETFRWRKAGKLITNNRNRAVFRNVLVINSNDDDNFGEYFCELQNYPGKGIRMNLLKITEENSESESTRFLVPFIIMLILFVAAIVVILYLLFMRTKSKSTTSVKRIPAAHDNAYNPTDEMQLRDKAAPSDQENPYADLGPRREESVYQSLTNGTDQNRETNEKSQDEETVYEEVMFHQGS